MTDQTYNEECLELLDAIEIGIELSEYQQAVAESTEQ